MQTFRRRVLDVSHIEIQTPAVTKKTSVTRWLFVIAVMQIDGAGRSVSEKMVFYLRRPEFGIYVRLFFAQKTAVFGFDSNDSVHCLASIRQGSVLLKCYCRHPERSEGPRRVIPPPLGRTGGMSRFV